MEDKYSSMTIFNIHGVSVKTPVRKTPFGRTFAVTTDGRQWTRHERDRNKIHCGWVELDPNSRKLSLSSSLSSGLTTLDLDAPVNPACELCSVHTTYGKHDVDGELQLQLIIMNQISTKGEASPWGLFIGRESGKGEMLMIKRSGFRVLHQQLKTANMFADEDIWISKIYTMALSLSAKQVLLIKEVASSIQTPSISDINANRAGSPTWCCDVLRQLVVLGIVSGKTGLKMDAMYQSLIPGVCKGDERIKAMAAGEWNWVTKDGEVAEVHVVEG